MGDKKHELTFLRHKLPTASTMPGVSFHASDVTMNANGGQTLLIFGGARVGLSDALWGFEPGEGDGFTQQCAGPRTKPHHASPSSSQTPHPATQL